MTRFVPGFLLPENMALGVDDAIGSGVVWE
jgi:hypothetical protein